MVVVRFKTDRKGIFVGLGPTGYCGHFVSIHYARVLTRSLNNKNKKYNMYNIFYIM